MIKKENLLCEQNPQIFMNSLRIIIDDYQSEGLHVEVQYGLDNGIYTALVIARTK